MKMHFLLTLLLFFATPGNAQYLITSIAGTDSYGFSGDNGPATNAQIWNTFYVCADTIGNVYISCQGNQRVRKIDAATGIITTVAGNGIGDNTGDGGQATDAALKLPKGVCLDRSNNLYVSSNNVVRRVNLTTGIISTVAGNGIAGHTGDGGPATAAAIGALGLATDQQNNLYIASYVTVRKVDAITGIITTIAGTGVAGYSGDGGPATAAMLDYTNGIAVSKTGAVYLGNAGCIRKIDGTGIITTVAGTGITGYTGDGGPATNAQVSSATGVSVDDSDNIYISDVSVKVIRKVTAATGIINTIAGDGMPGSSGDGGPATAARFWFPWGLFVNAAGSIVYVADRDGPVRKLYLPGVGVSDISPSHTIRVFPNPSTGVFTVSTGISASCNIVVCNALGQRVCNLSCSYPAATIDLSKEPPGVYYVTISGNEWRHTERVLIAQ